jgi:hypothetical protein
MLILVVMLCEVPGVLGKAVVGCQARALRVRDADVRHGAKKLGRPTPCQTI